jgi:hypothetical protein
MAESAKEVGWPRIATRLLQLGLIAQLLCELYLCIQYATGIEPADVLSGVDAGQVNAAVHIALSGLLIINFILLMTWLFCAVRFIESEATPDLTFSPGWAIVWWFVPVANFVAPFMVMYELYNASRAPETWKSRSPPIIAILWWGATLSAAAIGLVIRFSRILNYETPPATLMNAGLYGFGTLRLLFLLMLVASIAHFQKAVSKSANVDKGVF